jgi:hypothetical protein
MLLFVMLRVWHTQCVNDCDINKLWKAHFKFGPLQQSSSRKKGEYLHLVDSLSDQKELNTHRRKPAVMSIQCELDKRNCCPENDQPGILMKVM